MQTCPEPKVKAFSQSQVTAPLVLQLYSKSTRPQATDDGQARLITLIKWAPFGDRDSQGKDLLGWYGLRGAYTICEIAVAELVTGS
jgi:hypothetical protein